MQDLVDQKTVQQEVEEKLAEDEKRAAPRHQPPGSPLYSAMHAIYGEVRRLEQTEHNKHGHYDFTPADDFRDFMRKQFFKHKLIDRMNEVYSSAVSEGMKAGTLKFQYEFWIVHVESGESTQPVTRSVFLPYVGSPTAGIASTFGWKEWVKNEFKISTGEPDPAHQMSEADERTGEKLSVPESEEAAGHLSDTLQELIKNKPARAELEAWRAEAHPVLTQLQGQHFNALKAVYTRAFKAAEE